MDYEEFIKSVQRDSPPANASPLLVALWHDAKNDWEASHNVAQDINDRNGSWIHAYLHRREGDLSNARYWYSKAGKPECKLTLKQEWETLVKEFTN
jgi:hypothetical protein